MNKTEFMVFWIMDDGYCNATPFFNDNSDGSAMNRALAFANTLRKDPLNRFVTVASESVENVGKMGVDAVVDGKCPDGGDFLGRLSRHGMMLKRGR